MATRKPKEAAPLLPLAPGARVHHKELGHGQVLGLLRDGRAAVVRFGGGGLEIHVPARELVVTVAAPELSPVSPVKPRSAFESLQILEALRLGVVPDGHPELYTVGRDGELAQVKADLTAAAQGQGAGRLVVGDFGTGKTHLIECTAQEALSRGFIVARASLDPATAPPSHPRRVYRALIQGLRYPEGGLAGSLQPLIEKAAASEPARAWLKDNPHHYLSAAVEAAVRAPADLEPLLGWLSGAPDMETDELNKRYPGRFGGLQDYRPWAHVYAYLLSGLASLAKVLGYAGIAVLLDEGELFRVLSAENRRYALRLFRALLAAALPPSELPFDPEQEPKGGQGRTQALPFRFTADAPLYTMLALTPLPEASAIVEQLVRLDRVCTLSRLGREDYRRLARRLVALYAERSPALAGRVEALAELFSALMYMALDSAGGEGGGTLAMDTPRTAVRLVIWLLDLARIAPERVPKAIEGLKAIWL